MAKVTDPALLAALNSGDESLPEELLQQLNKKPKTKTSIGVTPNAIKAGLAENLLSLASGAVATPIAGISGLVSGAFAPSGKRLETAAKTIENVQSGLTYSPKSLVGKKFEEVNPLQLPAMAGQFAGEKTLQATGSPEAATVVDVATQALPALLTHRAGATKAASTQAEALASNLKAQQNAAVAAKNFVEQKTGLDWNGLSDNFRQKLTSIAGDATKLGSLDPAAVARQARLEKLGLPATRGQITREVPQLSSEESLTKSEAGAPVRNIYAAQDVRLHELLSRFQKPDLPSTSLGVGETVQTAARNLEKKSKSNYEELYKQARETEPNARVSADPVRELLTGSPEIQHLGFVDSWLKKGNIGDGGRNAVPLSELYDLRTKASKIARTGGTDGYYAGEVVGAIDRAMSEAPESAKAWRNATEAFKEHKKIFEEQGGVERLVSNATRTDPRVALEDTFDKTVRSGTAAQLSQVEKLLNQGGESGQRAWSTLQSATIDYLKNKAAGEMKVVGEKGQLQFNGSFLKALKELDADGKLDVLFGADDAAKLREIGEAVRDVRTKPDARIHGSATASNAMRLLEQFSSKVGDIPVVGDVAGGLIKAGQKLHQMGQEGRLVKEATTTPIQGAFEQAEKAKSGDVRAQKLSSFLMKYGYPAILGTSQTDRAKKLAKQLAELDVNSAYLNSLQ